VLTALPPSRLPNPPTPARADPDAAHGGDQVTNGQRRLPMPPAAGNASPANVAAMSATCSPDASARADAAPPAAKSITITELLDIS